jgi:hypothetical protein
LAFGPITRSTFPVTAATTRASVTGSTGGQIDQHDVRLLPQRTDDPANDRRRDQLGRIFGDATAGQELEDG